MRARYAVQVIEPIGSDDSRNVRKEVRVVEGVEKLRADLQLMAFVQFESSGHARIVEPLSGTDDSVAADIAILAQRHEVPEVILGRRKVAGSWIKSE